MADSLETNRDQLRRVADEQAALRRVATLVARGVSPPEVFGAVAGETGRVLGARSTAVVRFEPDGTATVVGAWDWPGVPGARSWPPPRPPVSSKDGCGVRSRRLFATVTADPDDTAGRLPDFTELVAMAVANTESHAQLAASRARVVAAADETRRRIERELHDGTQQRLISLALELRAAEARVPPEQRNLVHQWSRAAQALNDAVEVLREISRGLHPAALEKGGLGPALRTLGRRAGVPVTLNVTVTGRLPERIEVAAYYVVSETLTNAAKHSRASSRVEVNVDVADDLLQLLIRDNGVGGADLSRGSGLIGLSDRVEAVGGRIEITSPPAEGTSLLVTIPLPGRSA